MSDKQIPLDESAIAEQVDEDGLHEIADDLAYKRLAIVNVVFYGTPPARTASTEDAPWVLIDTGLHGMSGRIVRAAAKHFGENALPSAIILTHGHADHVGGLEALAESWDVPIYAHELELPFLDGRESYPPPDPTVGGLMSLTSPMFSRGPIDVSRWLGALPGDGSVPGMPGFRWIHTPGHTPGHVSLWRADDKTLIAGDAFITTHQESAYAVATQEPELHGPPTYYTPDWPSARESVRRLAALDPELVITGHGRAMHGPLMRDALHLLARDFDSIAVPKHGRYVDGRVERTSRDDEGVMRNH
jgi:glyoxylase-like metal-dependent hydrolase (beta-lactamase superfamily II)